MVVTNGSDVEMGDEPMVMVEKVLVNMDQVDRVRV